MKKSLIYSLLITLMIYFGAGELTAQSVKLNRWVMGSGGMIDSKNDQNWKLSGTLGQVAIERVKGGVTQPVDLWQGFWVPSTKATDVVDPLHPGSGDLVNFPNPVKTSTNIRYNLPGTANVTLKVYNVSGNLVKVLFDGIQDAGQQESIWDVTDQSGQEVTAGSYLYELTVNPAQMIGSQGFTPYALRNVMIVIK